jgi:hypothetical protein
MQPKMCVGHPRLQNRRGNFSKEYFYINLGAAVNITHFVDFFSHPERIIFV